MGIYVITGGTTGIGAEVRKKLLEQGHEVFNIDYKGGDVCADLSQPEGRKLALEAVYEKYPEGIDGMICNAGVGPVRPADMIFALNFRLCTIPSSVALSQACNIITISTSCVRE